MLQDTRPATLDASGGTDPWAEFRVTHPGERTALLRQLRDGSVPIILNGEGGSAIGATLWAGDDSRLTLAVDARAPQLPRLLQGDDAVAVAYLDNIKLQFDLHGLMLVRGQAATTLQAAMPAVIYRFQRRGGYRVRAGERASPRARLRHPSIPDMQLALRILDVSIGGCALWLPDDVPPLAAGTAIADVQVELDPATHFGAALTLAHVGSLGTGGGGLRAGCEWRLGPGAERALQLWIDQAQKRQRLLAKA
jgi:c-di-GMP-binding flagellar brake protein YcgR